MKTISAHTKFILLLTLVALLLGSIFVAQVSFASGSQEGVVDDEGMGFSAEDVYYTVKPFDVVPNTFEAWIQLPTNTTGLGGTIIGNVGIGESIVSLEIFNNGRVRLLRVSKRAVTTEYTFPQTDVRTGEWIHIAVVRDAENGSVDCYLDGVLAQSLGLGKGTEDVLPTYAMYIGGDGRDYNENYFKGKIREIAVYSDARTAGEIATDYASMGSGDNLIAHYELSNKTKQVNFEDASGNAYDVKYVQTWVDNQVVPFDYAYSFMVVGDIQTLNWKYQDKLANMYDWIVDNVDDKKVKMVIGLGDITETDHINEWNFAKQQMQKLDGKVAYSIVRGNHDTISNYNATFPLTDYSDVVQGSYDKTMLATYQTMTIGQVKYLFLTLDYGANDAMLSWASSVCERYWDHHVVISTHAYMYRDNTTLDQNNACPPATNGGYNNGDDIWNKFIRKHKNITLVLSGHVSFDRIVTIQTEGDHGNVVTQMLIDPQNIDAVCGGLGIVSTFYFSADGRQVFVDYYSVDRNKYFRSDNQFSITLDMADLSQEEQQQVGGVTIAFSPQNTNGSSENIANNSSSKKHSNTANVTNLPITGENNSFNYWTAIVIPSGAVILSVIILISILQIRKRKEQISN